MKLPHDGAEALPGHDVPPLGVVDGEALVRRALTVPSAAAHTPFSLDEVDQPMSVRISVHTKDRRRYEQERYRVGLGLHPHGPGTDSYTDPNEDSHPTFWVGYRILTPDI